jgi:hypothetical protein
MEVEDQEFDLCEGQLADLKQRSIGRWKVGVHEFEISRRGKCNGVFHVDPERPGLRSRVSARIQLVMTADKACKAAFLRRAYLEVPLKKFTRKMKFQ